MDIASLVKVSLNKVEFDYGFWRLGYIIGIDDMLLLLVSFFAGFFALKFGYYFKGRLLLLFGEVEWKSSILNAGIFSGLYIGGVSCANILSFNNGFFRLEYLPLIEEDVKAFCSSKCLAEEKNEDKREAYYDEEGDMDIVALKEVIKIERERAKAAYLELEKERMASTEAAEEAMAMILRLQHEKSSTELQAHQYRKMAEQKQLYDQEVIKSLRWIIMDHESEDSITEIPSKSLEKRHEQNHCKGQEEEDEFDCIDQGSYHFSFSLDDHYEHEFISSLEMESILI